MHGIGIVLYPMINGTLVHDIGIVVYPPMIDGTLVVHDKNPFENSGL